jgi:hypothetical protein
LQLRIEFIDNIFLFNPLAPFAGGFSKMIVSTILMGELSVAVLALPAFPKTFFTSGTLLMILSCTCNNCLASEFDMSGKVTGINKIEPSSNGGINSLPKLRSNGMLISKAIMLMPMVVLRQVSTSLI